ncbi:Transmembrane protein [Quillaja saponaria]|uniref:Transmembrane protein n=1 Tax=Quillaja saponaria TaxID=32244 RepID=A0AAD7M4U9_QUISA|nr:Transmembrane protein [Quillaja saponaria]
MSGGVVPTCNDVNLQKPTITTPPAQRKARFPSIRHLIALAVIIVFSASGMVSPEDFVFVLFSIIYMYFMSKVAFPSLHPAAKEPTVFNPQNKTLRLYVLVAAIIGLLLPVAYIFEGIFEGDREGIKAAAPHVFLLASQVFMEGIAFSDRNEIWRVDGQHSVFMRRLYIG